MEPPVRIELRPILTDADRPLERGGDADVPLTCIFFLSVRRIQAHSGRNRRDGTSSGKVGVAASPTPPGPTFTRTPRETRDEPTSGSSPKSEVHLARGRQLKQARHSPWRRDRHIGCWAPPSADATAVRGRSLYGAKALVSDTLSRGARCISANIRQALAGRSTVEPRGMRRIYGRPRFRSSSWSVHDTRSRTVASQRIADLLRDRIPSGQLPRTPGSSRTSSPRSSPPVGPRSRGVAHPRVSRPSGPQGQHRRLGFPSPGGHRASSVGVGEDLRMTGELSSGPSDVSLEGLLGSGHVIGAQ